MRCTKLSTVSFFFCLFCLSTTLTFAEVPDNRKIPVLFFGLEKSADPSAAKTLEKEIRAKLQTLSLLTVVADQELSSFLKKESINPFGMSSSEQSLLIKRFSPQLLIRGTVLPPIETDHRNSWIFFNAEKHITRKVDFIITAPGQAQITFRGTLQADTLLSLGYCGIWRCIPRTLKSMERMELESSLQKKLLSQVEEVITNLFQNTDVFWNRLARQEKQLIIVTDSAESETLVPQDSSSQDSTAIK